MKFSYKQFVISKFLLVGFRDKRESTLGVPRWQKG